MKKRILLLLIIIVAVITRGYLLGSVPKGIYSDEAAIGYSAYSILHTGKDEFGKSFPIVFRSFLDFKTPIYIYLSVPLIQLFGLNALSIRLASYIFSILTIFIFYLLIEELTDGESSLSTVSTLLLALSPWHILFGRTAFECTVALFFLLLGLLTFFKGLKKPHWFIFSAASFAISIEAYHAERIVVPLLLSLLLLRYRKTIFKKRNIKHIVGSIFVGFLILLPMLFVVKTPGFSARAVGLNIFNYSKQNPHGYQDPVGVISTVANFKPMLSVKEFTSLYISYFSPRNMFIIGDADLKSSYPYLSTFFLWQLPFYLIGLYVIVKEKRFKDLRFITIALFLITPLAASFTRDPYSTIRALPLVIPQMIIISIGVLYVYTRIRHGYLNNWAIVSFLLLLFYSGVKLYSSGILLNEYYHARLWNYGWENVVKTVELVNSTQLPVVVDNSRGDPYIYLLFFTRFDPERYLNENREIAVKDYYQLMERDTTKKIGNFITRPIQWEVDLKQEGFLVGDALAISKQQIAEHKLTLVKEVDYPDGSTAFRIVKVNK